MLGTVAFKAPALQLAQMNARINPLGTFVYTLDYKGQHTRYKIVHEVARRILIVIMTAIIIIDRFGYGGDVSHYPFTAGVSHSDDLIYLFPYPPDVAVLNEQDTKTAQTLVDLWTSFARNGAPELSKSEEGINVMSWQPFLGTVKSLINFLIV